MSHHPDVTPEPGSAAPAPPTEAATPVAGCDLPWCGDVPLAGRVTGRLMMPVAWLTAHPGNVRAGLDLSREFLASIAENGVLVPLRITPDGEGEGRGYRVIDGHRRLAAALQLGLAEVPYDLAAERQGDEAGQFLDMYTAQRHRKPFTAVEEADALFAAPPGRGEPDPDPQGHRAASTPGEGGPGRRAADR